MQAVFQPGDAIDLVAMPLSVTWSALGPTCCEAMPGGHVVALTSRCRSRQVPMPQQLRPCGIR